MKLVITIILIAVSFIHLAPSIGLLGGRWLVNLYGLEFADPNLQILMRHRAVLFGLLGVFLLVAAFRPDLQFVAIVVGLISTVSFILLVWQSGQYNAHLAKVAQVDAIAIAGLLLALVLSVYTR